jgi:hypothetical protein
MTKNLSLLFGERDAIRMTDHMVLVETMNQVRRGVNAYDPIGSPDLRKRSAESAAESPFRPSHRPFHGITSTPSRVYRVLPPYTNPG